MHVVIDTFAAGSPWVLEFLTPAENWVSVEAQAFNGDGVWTVDTFPGGRFRFNGGAAGAQIWVVGTYAIEPVEAKEV